MSGMLDSGTSLTTDSGTALEVFDLLGSGGQGEVYRVRTPAGDQALKWYYPSCATPEQQAIVRQLVERDFDDDRFLWPREFVADHRGGFGYLMDVRPERFKGLPLLFRRALRTTPGPCSPPASTPSRRTRRCTRAGSRTGTSPGGTSSSIR